MEDWMGQNGRFEEHLEMREKKHSLPNYSLKCDWMRRKYRGMSLKGEKGKSMISDTGFHSKKVATIFTNMKCGMR